nr:MarR family transcriptional regulator [uncultured Hyphomonas sp.]
MTDSQFLETRAAFALRVKQLHDRLSEQLDAAMAKCGLLIPGKTTGIVQLLYSEGPCSKADIADRLRYSHQLTTQRLAWLLKHGMAETNPDPEDGRRQIVSLTPDGAEQAQILQTFLPRLQDAYSSLFSELGMDLDTEITNASRLLDTKPLADRI